MPALSHAEEQAMLKRQLVGDAVLEAKARKGGRGGLTIVCIPFSQLQIVVQQRCTICEVFCVINRPKTTGSHSLQSKIKLETGNRPDRLDC